VMDLLPCIQAGNDERRQGRHCDRRG
jgi:hypothetical protein